MTHYREALLMLAQAGYEPAQIAQFTHCPQIVPSSQIQLSFTQQSQGCDNSQTPSGEILDFGVYKTLSTISAGLNNSVLPIDDVISADIKFQIAINGQTSKESIMVLEPDTRFNRRQVNRVITNLQFRPRISEEKAVPIPAALLRIQLAIAP